MTVLLQLINLFGAYEVAGWIDEISEHGESVLFDLIDELQDHGVEITIHQAGRLMHCIENGTARYALLLAAETE